MRFFQRFFFLAGAVVGTFFLASISEAANSKVYKDPDGAYSVQVPEGWSVQRDLREAGWMTIISSKAHVAKLVILAEPIPPHEDAPSDLQEQFLRELGKPMFNGWFESLKGETKIRDVRKVYKTQTNGFKGLRMDVVYDKGDEHDPRQSCAVFFLSYRTSFFLVPSGDRQGFKEAYGVLTSLQVEPGR
jgi:hypothetical protein